MTLGKFRKRAISEVVAYVILITISLSLSAMVYTWLRFYTGETSNEVCPDGASIVISDYNCVPGTVDVSGKLNITLKNKGLFTLDGFTIRVNNRQGATVGIFTLNDTGQELLPGNSTKKEYRLGSVPDSGGQLGWLRTVTLLEVQAFVLSKNGNDRLLCGDVSRQTIDC